MFVDKKLEGLHAVQTLSRLNRIHPTKESTFVLDFVNSAEDIKNAFKPYYEQTEIAKDIDPNQLNTLKNKLDDFQIYWQQEVEQFAKVFFKPRHEQKPSDQGLLHKAIDPAIARFKVIADEEAREDFRHHLLSYIRFYSFVSQIIYPNIELEKLYVFGRLLATKLPKRKVEDPLDLDGDVALTYYRLNKTFEGSAILYAGETAQVYGADALGTGRDKPEEAPLSEVIQALNDKFGTEFNEEDRLLFDQVVGYLASDEKLREQARNNTLENFKHAFDEKAFDAFLQRMERNEKISGQFTSNEEFRNIALQWMLKKVYQRSREADTKE